MVIKTLATGSGGNCYLIDDGKTQLLLDAGIPYKEIQKRMSFTTGNVSGCLITHRHGDHSKAIPQLTCRGIPTYGSAELQAEFPRIRAIEEFQTLGIGTFDVLPFPLVHDAPCWGYQIFSYHTGETLVYITDTAEIPYSFKDTNFLLVEANHSMDIIVDRVGNGEISTGLADRILETHLSIERLKAWIVQQDTSKLKEVILIHLSDENSDADKFVKAIQEVLPVCARVRCGIG